MRWRVYPIREFDRLTSDWNALNAAAGDLPFLRSEFLVAGVAGIRDRERDARDVRPRRRHHAAMGMLRRRAPGNVGNVPALAAAARRFPAAQRNARRRHPRKPVLRALPGLAVAVALTQQDPAFVARPPDSLLVETLDYIETATLTLGGTFDDYWAARGKNLRHNVKRQRAKLQEQSVPLKLDVIDTPERRRGRDRRLWAARRLGLEGARGDGGRPRQRAGPLLLQRVRDLLPDGEGADLPLSVRRSGRRDGSLHRERGRAGRAQDHVRRNGEGGLARDADALRNHEAALRREAASRASSSTARRWSGTCAGRAICARSTT